MTFLAMESLQYSMLAGSKHSFFWTCVSLEVGSVWIARPFFHPPYLSSAGDTKRADGNGNRTLGGMFLREEKRFKASAHLTQVQRVLPPLPPLRSYQRDMVAMVLLSWGMTLPSELLELPAARVGDAGGLEEGEIEAEDSEAALRARWERMAGGWSSNWLVSAPTNSGKTRMFVEVARWVGLFYI